MEKIFKILKGLLIFLNPFKRKSESLREIFKETYFAYVEYGGKRKYLSVNKDGYLNIYGEGFMGKLVTNALYINAQYNFFTSIEANDCLELYCGSNLLRDLSVYKVRKLFCSENKGLFIIYCPEVEELDCRDTPLGGFRSDKLKIVSSYNKYTYVGDGLYIRQDLLENSLIQNHKQGVIC